MKDKCREALAELVAAASDYVKPRRATDARQVLLAKLDAARAALAQPADCARFAGTHPTDPDYDHSEAYLRAQPAEPAMLSDEQITRIWFESASGKITPTYFEFARAIERAHGIKSEGE